MEHILLTLHQIVVGCATDLLQLGLALFLEVLIDFLDAVHKVDQLLELSGRNVG